MFMHKRSSFVLLVPVLACLIVVFHGGEAGAMTDNKRGTGPGNGKVCELEDKFIKAGLVNIREIDDSILVDLKYACTRNFMNANVYGDIKDGYLRKDAALMLKKASELLKARNPELRLLVVDGCRPRSVQRRMWEIVKGTPMQKYVANPAAASMHNYGMAVDLTLAAPDGTRLDMGTPMDHFGELAQPALEARFLKAGKLTEDQVKNRRLLRDVMTKAGFQVLSIEWWHFNACDRKVVKSRYGVIE